MIHEKIDGPNEQVEAVIAAMKRAWEAESALKASGNYVCDDEANPTVVTFANGRVVSLVDGKLQVSWAHDAAQEKV